MAAITTRQTAGTGATVAGVPLTNAQLDTNFINLNNDVLSRLSTSGGTITGNLTITGSVSASTKSFLIPHPTKPNSQLRYGSLEGPENGVYVRGRCKTNIIPLPEYWTKLVDPDSITVQLTPVGTHQKLYVEKIEHNCVYIATDNLFGGAIDCFYNVYGERCDVDKLQVEA
jgi:hypothetical protein